MADLGQLTVKIDSDVKGLNSGLKKITESTARIAKGVAVGAAAASAALAGIAVTSIKLAQDQERAEARLESIAKKVAGATDEQVDSLKRLASAYQNVSTFGDEVLIAGQSQILSFGTTAEQAEMLTGSLTDLLAANNGMNASQEDAINAANMLGKAINGQAGALSRAGILLTEQQTELIKTGDQATRVATIVEVMNDNYGGLAKTLSETSEGQMIQAKNAIGDIGEVIGQSIIPTLNKFLKVVQDNLPKVQEIATSVFSTIGEWLGKTYDFFNDNIMPVLKTLQETATTVFETIRPIIETAFTVIVEKATMMYDFFVENILPIFEKLWTTAEEVFPSVMETVKTAFDGVWEAAKIIWAIFEDNLLPIFKAFYNFINDNWDVISTVIKVAWKIVEVASKIIVDIFIDLLKGVKAVFDFMSGPLSTVGSIVETAFNVVKSSVKGVIDTFVKVKDVIDKAIKSLKEFFKAEEKDKNMGGGSLGVVGSTKISGQKAFGGAVKAGESYLVNERSGGEIFTPSRNGTISAGANNININVNGAADPMTIADQIVNILNSNGVKTR